MENILFRKSHGKSTIKEYSKDVPNDELVGEEQSFAANSVAPLSKENLSKPPKKGIAAWLGQAIGQTNRCGMLRMNDSYCVVSLCKKLRRVCLLGLELVDMTS